MTITLGLKIDVDTERGTRFGVPKLATFLKELELKGTFLFSLGPDNTGRAIKQIFRPGFLKKVSRTSVLQIYGLKTLLNGLLWPGPLIGKKHAVLMLDVAHLSHEVGIHCYDHRYWQDNLFKMSENEVKAEFQKAVFEFEKIFNLKAQTAGAAGWQANLFSLKAYDQEQLTYASDTRGEEPFYPKVGSYISKTLQLPTTLPTLDELLGRPEYPFEKLIDFYIEKICSKKFNIFTLHAELEGISYFEWFKAFIKRCQQETIQIKPLKTIAEDALKHSSVPICELVQGMIDGRSGNLAKQKTSA